MRVHRQEVERAALPEPWQVAARRLELEYPDRWGSPRVREFVRDPDDCDPLAEVLASAESRRRRVLRDDYS